MDELKYLDKDGLIFYDQAQKQRLTTKVDKEFKTGSSSEYKVLSDNNLTDELKQKILDAGTGSFTGVYNDLIDLPTLNGITIKGALTLEQLGIAKAYDLLQLQGDVANAMADIEEMQQEGYQTKEQVEQAITSKGYATESWVNGKGYQNESEVQSLIDDALADITGIDFKVVPQLPDSGEKGTIYLVSNSGSGQNTYDEYIWLSDQSKWEKIGTTDVDLSDYIRKDDLVPISNEEITQIVSGS